ncbi:MAG: penicillin acylase family protein [Cytophagales bacterium]|nr:penicillin acylase family protein [Bernardetiaceae bacterium]MDW8209630.1 penicillin acylase family protein [Cytophagales bacterium]
MKLFKFLLSLSITAVLAFALNNKLGQVPPLGKFLNPFDGFWQNAQTKEQVISKAPKEVHLDGLKGRVEVIYDERLVPHIFAENEEDLYFMQGYVTAQHRLWQMEFQTHAAAGRICEIVGKIALELDRTNRRKGLAFGAERAVALMDSLPLAKMLLTQYAKGVNAYINSLTYKDLPIEYKLFDYYPEPWTPLKTALLLKYMANTLASGDDAIENTNTLKLLGRPTFDLLFPDYHPEQAPIVPTEGKWNFEPLKVNTPKVQFSERFYHVVPLPKPEPNTGSNNWAVSGGKTASGNPILCDDPHLTLSLPSIWFEMQLAAPGVNTYGVTLPGAPNVIIGFNDSIAWGVTNAQRDVLDLYAIEYKDHTRQEYFFEGKWRKTTKRIEEIKIRHQQPYYDTVIYTHWGPVTYDKKFHQDRQHSDLAMRWTAHDPSLELFTFYYLNRAKNYQDFVKAISYFDCPAQNFAFASVKGDIAMHVQGKYPLKWREQGKFILDGSNSASAWQGFIPDEHNVQVLNPKRGYVSSANQHPTDTLYPYYIYAGNYEYYRNRRINGLLDSMNAITPQMMMAMQNDNFNLKAAESLPYFLAQIDTTLLNASQKPIYRLLSKWDFYNHPEAEAPSYYEAWWSNLIRMLWDEFLGKGIPYARPDAFTTIKLLKKYPQHPLFDNQQTPDRETAREIIIKSFLEAIDSLARWQQQHGGQLPLWADFKATSIQHLARIEPFGVKKVRNGGNRNIINATSERHGPSWRMVVELDKKGVKGWGVYPGGQSGNPGSPYYANMIDHWREGKYYELLFMSSPLQPVNNILFRQTFIN